MATFYLEWSDLKLDVSDYVENDFTGDIDDLEDEIVNALVPFVATIELDRGKLFKASSATVKIESGDCTLSVDTESLTVSIDVSVEFELPTKGRFTEKAYEKWDSSSEG